MRRERRQREIKKEKKENNDATSERIDVPLPMSCTRRRDSAVSLSLFFSLSLSSRLVFVVVLFVRGSLGTASKVSLVRPSARGCMHASAKESERGERFGL